MTTLRGGAQHLPASRVQAHARAVMIALGAALAVALTALVIVLATSSGDAAEPVRVAPTSSTTPPPEQRAQPPGVNGPGARP